MPGVSRSFRKPTAQAASNLSLGDILPQWLSAFAGKPVFSESAERVGYMDPFGGGFRKDPSQAQVRREALLNVIPGGKAGQIGGTTAAALVPKTPMARAAIAALQRTAPKIYDAVQELPDISVKVAGQARVAGRRYKGLFWPTEHKIDIDEFLPIDQLIATTRHEATHPLFRAGLNEPFKKIVHGGMTASGRKIQPLTQGEWFEIDTYMARTGRDPTTMSVYDKLNELVSDASEGADMVFQSPRLENLFRKVRSILLAGGSID